MGQSQSTFEAHVCKTLNVGVTPFPLPHTIVNPTAPATGLSSSSSVAANCPSSASGESSASPGCCECCKKRIHPSRLRPKKQQLSSSSSSSKENAKKSGGGLGMQQENGEVLFSFATQQYIVAPTQSTELQPTTVDPPSADTPTTPAPDTDGGSRTVVVDIADSPTSSTASSASASGEHPMQAHHRVLDADSSIEDSDDGDRSPSDARSSSSIPRDGSGPAHEEENVPQTKEEFCVCHRPVHKYHHACSPSASATPGCVDVCRIPCSEFCNGTEQQAHLAVQSHLCFASSALSGQHGDGAALAYLLHHRRRFRSTSSGASSMPFGIIIHSLNLANNPEFGSKGVRDLLGSSRFAAMRQPNVASVQSIHQCSGFATGAYGGVSTYLTTLDLTNCGLGDEGVITLANALFLHEATAKEVSFSSSALGLSTLWSSAASSSSSSSSAAASGGHEQNSHRATIADGDSLEEAGAVNVAVQRTMRARIASLFKSKSSSSHQHNHASNGSASASTASSSVLEMLPPGVNLRQLLLGHNNISDRGFAHLAAAILDMYDQCARRRRREEATNKTSSSASHGGRHHHKASVSSSSHSDSNSGFLATIYNAFWGVGYGRGSWSGVHSEKDSSTSSSSQQRGLTLGASECNDERDDDADEGVVLPRLRLLCVCDNFLTDASAIWIQPLLATSASAASSAPCNGGDGSNRGESCGGYGAGLLSLRLSRNSLGDDVMQAVAEGLRLRLLAVEEAEQDAFRQAALNEPQLTAAAGGGNFGLLTQQLSSASTRSAKHPDATPTKSTATSSASDEVTTSSSSGDVDGAGGGGIALELASNGLTAHGLRPVVGALRELHQMRTIRQLAHVERWAGVAEAAGRNRETYLSQIQHTNTDDMKNKKRGTAVGSAASRGGRQQKKQKKSVADREFDNDDDDDGSPLRSMFLGSLSPHRITKQRRRHQQQGEASSAADQGEEGQVMAKKEKHSGKNKKKRSLLAVHSSLSSSLSSSSLSAYLRVLDLSGNTSLGDEGVTLLFGLLAEFSDTSEMLHMCCCELEAQTIAVDNFHNQRNSNDVHSDDRTPSNGCGAEAQRRQFSGHVLQFLEVLALRNVGCTGMAVPLIAHVLTPPNQPNAEQLGLSSCSAAEDCNNNHQMHEEAVARLFDVRNIVSQFVSTKTAEANATAGDASVGCTDEANESLKENHQKWSYNAAALAPTHSALKKTGMLLQEHKQQDQRRRGRTPSASPARARLGRTPSMSPQRHVGGVHGRVHVPSVVRTLHFRLSQSRDRTESRSRSCSPSYHHSHINMIGGSSSFAASAAAAAERATRRSSSASPSRNANPSSASSEASTGSSSSRMPNLRVLQLDGNPLGDAAADILCAVLLRVQQQAPRQEDPRGEELETLDEQEEKGVVDSSPDFTLGLEQCGIGGPAMLPAVVDYHTRLHRLLGHATSTADTTTSAGAVRLDLSNNMLPLHTIVDAARHFCYMTNRSNPSFGKHIAATGGARSDSAAVSVCANLHGNGCVLRHEDDSCAMDWADVLRDYGCSSDCPVSSFGTVASISSFATKIKKKKGVKDDEGHDSEASAASQRKLFGALGVNRSNKDSGQKKSKKKVDQPEQPEESPPVFSMMSDADLAELYMEADAVLLGNTVHKPADSSGADGGVHGCRRYPRGGGGHVTAADVLSEVSRSVALDHEKQQLRKKTSGCGGALEDGACSPSPPHDPFGLLVSNKKATGKKIEDATSCSSGSASAALSSFASVAMVGTAASAAKAHTTAQAAGATPSRTGRHGSQEQLSATGTPRRQANNGKSSGSTTKPQFKF